MTIASGPMAAYVSMNNALHLIGLQGHTICGNHLNYLWSLFSFAGLLIVFSAVGWRIAHLSKYGAGVARGVVFGAAAIWLIAYCNAKHLWPFDF